MHDGLPSALLLFSTQGFLPPPRAPWIIIGFSNRQHHPTRRSGSPRAISDPRVFQTRIGARSPLARSLSDCCHTSAHCWAVSLFVTAGCVSVFFKKMAEQAYTTDIHSHTSAQMPISDGHLSANGGVLQGPSPPPAAAAGLPLGRRSRVHRRRKRKRPPPPGGGRGSDHPCSHRACRRRRRRRRPRGRRFLQGSRPGARRRPRPPGECLSEARYRLLRHAPRRRFFWVI